MFGLVTHFSFICKVGYEGRKQVVLKNDNTFLLTMLVITTVSRESDLLPKNCEYGTSVRNSVNQYPELLDWYSTKNVREKKWVGLVPPCLHLSAEWWLPSSVRLCTWKSQSGEVMKNGLRDWQGPSCVNRIYLLNIDEKPRWYISHDGQTGKWELLYLSAVSSLLAAGIGCSHELDTGTLPTNKPRGMKSQSMDNTSASQRLLTDDRCSCIYINAQNTLCLELFLISTDTCWGWW